MWKPGPSLFPFPHTHEPPGLSIGPLWPSQCPSGQVTPRCFFRTLMPAWATMASPRRAKLASACLTTPAAAGGMGAMRSTGSRFGVPLPGGNGLTSHLQPTALAGSGAAKAIPSRTLSWSSYSQREKGLAPTRSSPCVSKATCPPPVTTLIFTAFKLMHLCVGKIYII